MADVRHNATRMINGGIEKEQRLPSPCKKAKQFCRKTSSLTLFFSGIIVVVTSLILYIAPPTHVAHFSDWCMAGFNKGQWNVLHLVSGLLFVIAMFAHTCFNWKTMLVYFKSAKGNMVPLSKPFVVSLALTVYICTGSLLGLPPMSQFIQWIRSVKISHVQKYGAPPYGRAEKASLKIIATYMGWDANKSFFALREKGIAVESATQSIRSIARNNDISIGAVLENMRN